MGNEMEKAAAFAGRLWENPALAGLSPLQKEDQLLQFLDLNSRTLLPTLSSPAFFPGQSWPGILVLLKKALSGFADRDLSTVYENLLNKKLDLSFTQHMAHRSSTPTAVKKQLGEFLNTLSSKPGTRRELSGPLSGVGNGVIDRYMEKIFQRQKYISFELRKVQRLKMSFNEITDLVKTTMLIRPAVRYFTPGAQPSTGSGNLLLVSPGFASKVGEEVRQAIPLMPEAVVKAAVNSALSFQDNTFLESTSRLAAVFSYRCRNMKPDMKTDRGAEASDKSWFSVARKNYRYYGFDLDMLMELQNIATENGW